MTLPMILLGGGGLDTVKSLVLTGDPVTYGVATTNFVLPAEKVFPGGIALMFWTNRDNQSLPTTPSGWTLLASGAYSTNHSGALFGKLTPTSQQETFTASVTGKNGAIWGMKFSDGSPIPRIRKASNSPNPVVGNVGATVSNLTATKIDEELLFPFGLLWMYGDTVIAEAITGLEAGFATSALFSFNSSSDGFRGVWAESEKAIRAAGGTLTFSASGLTVGNSMVHMPYIMDLKPPPPGALTATYRSAQFSSTQNAVGVPYTWASVPIVDEGAADRYVVVCVGTTAVAGVNTAPTITSVTVDGVELDVLQSWGITPGSGMRTAIYGGIVNTPDTTPPISVTFGTTATRGCAIAVYTLTGAENVQYIDSEVRQYNNTGCDFKNFTMVEDTDVWIGFGHHFGNTASFTWTVATEQNELNYSSGVRTSSALLTLSGVRSPTFSCGSAGDGLAACVQLRGVP